MLQFPLSPKKPYTALALNYKLPPFFDALWKCAALRVSADGGANRVHKNFIEKKQNNYIVPDIVAGDFDSLKKDVRQYMESRGTKFIMTYNQDFNDVQKTINVIMKFSPKDPILVMGGYGGRFDHTVGVLNAGLWDNKVPVFLLDKTNMMIWVHPKDKGVKIPKTWTTGKCSLLPLSKPVRNIQTKGLKFNLNGQLKLGKHISLSNTMLSEDVLIKTSDPVLFTCQVPEERWLTPLE